MSPLRSIPAAAAGSSRLPPWLEQLSRLDWNEEMVLLSQTGEKVPVPPVSPGLPHHPGRVGPAALPGVSVPDEPLPQVACTSSCQQICPPAFTASRASRRPADCGSGRAPSSAAEANPRLPTNEPCCGCRLEAARLVLGEGEGGGASPSIAGSRRLFDHTAEGQ